MPYSSGFYDVTNSISVLNEMKVNVMKEKRIWIELNGHGFMFESFWFAIPLIADQRNLSTLAKHQSIKMIKAFVGMHK